MTDSWGFTHDPDTDLGSPLVTQPLSDGSEQDGQPGADTSLSSNEAHDGGPKGWVAPAALADREPFILRGWMVVVGTLALWLGASFGIAIGGQQALGITPDWRLGLTLAAAAPGGGTVIQTQHWALSAAHGPTLIGVIVLALWTFGFNAVWHGRMRRSGVPIAWVDVFKVAALGAGLHWLIAGVAKIVGVLIVVQGQQVWLSPDLLAMATAMWTMPVVTVVVGCFVTDLIPEAITPIVVRTLLRLTLAGLAMGIVLLTLAWGYGIPPLGLVLAVPLAIGMGLGMGSGAPLVLALEAGSRVVHASWGLGGVSGTLPVPVMLPLAGAMVVLVAAITAIGVRDVILATKSRRQGMWVVGAGAVLVLILVLSCTGSLSNTVEGAIPPAIIPVVAGALSNGMTVVPGQLWTLSLGVNVLLSVPTLMGVLGVAYGLGVGLAGRPATPWSGQELEEALHKVYKAGLIDQPTYDRGKYALNQAKKNAKKAKRTHAPQLKGPRR